ncbi:Mu transposase C-terminal domain-containing protein [Pseudonocardia parietis]|uniref:Transposase n=1 Tax=Pseudonocardia parietis TaxID=570936 RepID=A0ABS4W749_9PSEU|nr:Mu transposase C-terminal domain-containing protein [Pseudonocardia parietis]MBP2371753.1 putative transposase [Pseudonocardia parietis]
MTGDETTTVEATPTGSALTASTMTEAQRELAMARFAVLRPHLDDGVALTAAARHAGVPVRTAQRWLARYREAGLAGLARRSRVDRGRRRVPEQLVTLIEGMALRIPRPSAATIHRTIRAMAGEHGWPVPSYATVYAIVADLDPALTTLAHEGAKRYEEVFDLVGRREAGAPNEIWQADHTELDIWVIAPSGTPARPWLTVIEDDHSRAAAGYAVSLEAPSSLNTALALRQAIWRKPDPGWPVCGIPAVFYTDHGSDFTSRHLEAVAADLHVQLVFSLPGKPRGRGKIERLFNTINQMCLQPLPGYAPRGVPDRAGRAQLTLAELDAAIGAFLTGDYHHRVHSETRQSPNERWTAGGFLPRMPDSLEQLDLLLLTVAKPRKIHPDGVRFHGLRYLDPTLAAYVGEQVVIRYDPRDLAEIRIFHDEQFLCRAICPELAGRCVALKDLTAARNARRREVRQGLRNRASVVDQLVAVHRPGHDHPAAGTAAAPDDEPVPARRLKLYRED